MSFWDASIETFVVADWKEKENDSIETFGSMYHMYLHNNIHILTYCGIFCLSVTRSVPLGVGMLDAL